MLRIVGVPVGAELAERHLPCYVRRPATPRFPFAACSALATAQAAGAAAARADGSIIIVVATDAPLLLHQLKRLVKRPSLGLGRVGAVAADGSGDIFLAFSTANLDLESVDAEPVARSVVMYPNERLTPLFEATTQATEEAIVNALVAAHTMEGADTLRVTALPDDELKAVLRKYGRLVN